jgi:hypothetical protein
MIEVLIVVVGGQENQPKTKPKNQSRLTLKLCTALSQWRCVAGITNYACYCSTPALFSLVVASLVANVVVVVVVVVVAAVVVISCHHCTTLSAAWRLPTRSHAATNCCIALETRGKPALEAVVSMTVW